MLNYLTADSGRTYSAKNTPISVGQAAKLLKDTFKSPSLQICVRGELSEIKMYPSGHFYFSLLDCTGAEAKLPCVMWNYRANAYRKLLSSLKNGQCVDISGRFSIYERQGSFKMEALTITESGQGRVLEELERLRQKLEAEGLFKDSRKRRLPAFIKTVGVATSANGQAIKDICRTLKERAPWIKIILSPCLCQGEKADESIILAIHRLECRPDIDCIIAGRGGGSQGDLQAYNSENLVRAVAACSKPIISAVGHEGDIAFTDLAADLRASTPTRAAEMLSRSKQEFLTDLRGMHQKIISSASQYLCRESSTGVHLSEIIKKLAENKIKLLRTSLISLNRTLEAFNPKKNLENRSRELKAGAACLKSRSKALIQVKRIELENLQARFQTAADRILPALKDELKAMQTQIESISPAKTLDRGYAAVCDKDGLIDSRASSLKAGSEITVYMKKCTLKAFVTEVHFTESAAETMQQFFDAQTSV